MVLARVPGWEIGLALAAAAILLFLIVFRLMWRVAEPNEALIISGLREHGSPQGAGESLGFKIVTGRGTLVIPGIQQVRRLSLDLRESELSIDCVTHQGIPLGIRGVVIFKVGDDFTSIANSARRFLDQQDQMDARVHNVFAGHLRAIVGNPDQAHISTSLIERQNLTMRMSMRRFTRLTNAFSKKVENLRAAVSLHFAHYNFVRVHRTLRVTPAMEARVSDRLWSLGELVERASN